MQMKKLKPVDMLDHKNRTQGLIRYFSINRFFDNFFVVFSFISDAIFKMAPRMKIWDALIMGTLLSYT